MAELLEKRLLHLKAKLEDLKKSYAKDKRTLVADIQIQAIEEQIRNLSDLSSRDQTFH